MILSFEKAGRIRNQVALTVKVCLGILGVAASAVENPIARASAARSLGHDQAVHRVTSAAARGGGETAAHS
jgi:hypothetical protein